jgi:hypothetical protein
MVASQAIVFASAATQVGRILHAIVTHVSLRAGLGISVSH